VSVIVSVRDIAGVDMVMFVGLSVVAVLMRVLNMVMIMRKVRVGVRHILMRVLMSVRRGHPAPLFSGFGEASPYRNQMGLIIEATHLTRRSRASRY
jgi:hypothetical protein